MTQKKRAISLEEHHEIIYEIVYLIDDFCRSHSINYFLYGGTLLGAIRHNGIIPWDDDADLAMLRDDYQRFIELFQREKPKGYQLLSMETTPGYRIPLIKVTKDNTFFEHNGICDMDMGIWVDIMPIDGCPGTLDEAQRYFTAMHKKIDDYVIFESRTLKGKLLAELKAKGTIPICRKHRDNVLSRTLDQIKDNRTCKCQYAACVTNGLYGKGEVHPLEFFLNLSTHLFGTRSLPVPADWKKYLSAIYGDYMQLPPVEKRKHHSKYTTYVIEPSKEE